jgi:hypothetical protein
MTDTSTEAVTRYVDLHDAYSSDEISDETAALIEALAAERDRYKKRGDNHWETLRSIRHMAQTTGDLERIIHWVDDAGSGCTKTVEQTMVEISDQRNALQSQLSTAHDDVLDEVISEFKKHPNFDCSPFSQLFGVLMALKTKKDTQND